MRFRRLLPLTVPAVWLAVACGGSKPKPAPAPGPSAVYYTGTTTGPTTTPTMTSTVPTATATSTATATTTATTPATAGGANAVAINPALAAAAQGMLTTLAATQLPAGMTPEGAPFAAQFTEGQTFEQPLNLTPGKCYSVVAVAVPGGITELHINIANAFVTAIPLAQDTTPPGPNPVLGPRDVNCWKYIAPLPQAAKVILKASKGQGIALAQVYMR